MNARLTARTQPTEGQVLSIEGTDSLNMRSHSVLKKVRRDLVHRIFYPVVPIIVTSQSRKRIGGMAAVSCMPISVNPPLVGISISPKNRTHGLVKTSGCFALNWLDAQDIAKVAYCGFVSGSGIKDKISASGFHTRPGKELSLPIISEAHATAECRVVDRFVLGDHDLFIGEVVVAYATDDFDQYWLFKEYSPILYIGLDDDPVRKFIKAKIRG